MGADDRLATEIETYTREVEAALGPRLVALVLYGSAVTGDWVRGTSDVNTAIVVGDVTLDVLDALAPVVAARRKSGFAVPLVVDREYLDRARDVFPMELDDIRRRHRVLSGMDPFATVAADPAAVRRECEFEARSKLLRLRAYYLLHAQDGGDLAGLMAASAKSFLVLLRHLLQLRGEAVGSGYGDVVVAGERLLGPLAAFRAVLGFRTAPPDPAALRATFGGYLAEVERIVAAVDALGA